VFTLLLLFKQISFTKKQGYNVEADLLKTLIEQWPQGVVVIIVFFFLNRFFGWLAPIVELYVKAQVAWGEASSRTLGEITELLRTVDTRLAALEAHMFNETEHREKQSKARPQSPPRS